jgi:hypothetical protein
MKIQVNAYDCRQPLMQDIIQKLESHFSESYIKFVIKIKFLQESCI